MTVEGQVDTGRTTHLGLMHRDIPWKYPVRAATTANGTLATAFDNASVIDGVTLATGDRILIKDQTATEENGLYVVQASGIPFRVYDMDDPDEVQGAVVFVMEGTANAGSLWTTVSTPAVLDDDGIDWAEFTGSSGVDLSGINFLVGTASGDLSAEIVVGTTPGGELGGTWASPTVDATHSGSAHVTAHSGLTGLTSGDDHTQYVELADDLAVEIVIDGGGVAITTGVKVDVEMPFTGHIRGNRLFADQSGSIVIDLWKDTYANFPPTVADTITASAKPTLSSAAKSQDTTLTGWTTAFTAGDIIRVNVDSATTVQRVTLSLTVDRS
jgi:hypothetical protein